MNIAKILQTTARSFPSYLATAQGEKPVATYGQLGQRVRALAGSLRERLNLKHGDRVAIIMKNRPEYLEVMFAAWWAGLTIVPINAKLHQKEFEYVLDNSGARVCFTGPDLNDTVAPLADQVESLQRTICVADPEYAALCAGEGIDLAAVQGDEPAWLFYTSGTTGRPKGATLTHRVLNVCTLAYFADIDAILPGDSIIHAAPISHGTGLYALPHVAKAAAQVVPDSGSFEPEEILELMRRYARVTLFAAPTMLIRLMNAPGIPRADLTRLKTIFYGGGPMYVADLRKAIEVFGLALVQLYGQAESPNTITVLPRYMHTDSSHPRYLERLASVGIPRTCVEVRVADAEDRTLPPGELGEVLVRGDIVMSGYWQNPKASADTLRGGWLHTGDVGFCDEYGFLTLRDRSKDMIISGGSNIYPREVEEVLLKHPGVLEVSVVGRAHPDWVEEVVAFIVARPGHAPREEELDRLCLENIARFKRPRAYFFIGSLPKNNYGKVLKTELRQRLAAPAGA